MSTRRLAKTLYRKLLREAEKLPSYNFRMYAGRKIRETFRENKTINDFDKIDAQIEVARQSLEMLRRQAIIGHLYSAEKLVIERKKTLSHAED
ncbi:protein bcn92 [Stomoxys calcitrans]|uniref:Complex 1 LYR protein domain-containing protein n=1 Tax=Stomoxys calcitrans TaxID=35570 RepID=A0A1I8P9C5_STOCA|nr:protein bcn92 [Stomoxys calcitrans]